LTWLVVHEWHSSRVHALSGHTLELLGARIGSGLPRAGTGLGHHGVHLGESATLPRLPQVIERVEQESGDARAFRRVTLRVLPRAEDSPDAKDTPVTTAGVSERFWEISDLVAL
jgi:hypothetical protein